MKQYLTYFLVIVVNNCFAGMPSFKPELEIGYQPDVSSDEGGFWYQVDKLESEVQRSPYVVRNTELNSYIENLVCQLAGEYCDQIRVYIVKNPYFNASMYPNGMMHVHTGLLLRAKNEAQLAAVLGHEIAHYLLSHHIKRWRNLRDASATAIFLDLGLAMLTGVGGLGSMAVLSGVAAFSRDHETEADLYGLQILYNRGYAPEEAARLWEYLEAERAADETKASRSIFFATHPKVENRVEKLREASASYGTEKRPRNLGAERYLEMISQQYRAFMDEQIALQEHGQTETLLAQHEEMGFSSGLINFYRGELYRLRKGDGDIEQAISAYQHALESPDVPVESYRELAYLHMKRKENDEALALFKEYRRRKPDADDILMINFYIQTLEKQAQ